MNKLNFQFQNRENHIKDVENVIKSGWLTAGKTYRAI